MKRSNQQVGFSALIAVVTVLVVAGLGFAAWRISQAPTKSQTSQNVSPDKKSSNPKEKNGTFSCKDIFTISYPNSLQATTTDAGQCLISNVSLKEMPPVGPLPHQQLGLFFSTQTTGIATGDNYIDDYIERSQEDYPLELKSKEEVRLSNGAVATLAIIYGGHPTPHDFYFFVYIKNGTAIATSYPVNSDHKDVALNILKSIR